MNLMTKKLLEERLERTKQRYARQQERMENLLCSMQNNAENIRQIEYVLAMMEHVRKQRRRHRIIYRSERILYICFPCLRSYPAPYAYTTPQLYLFLLCHLFSLFV